MARQIKRPQWDAQSSGRIEGDACGAFYMRKMRHRVYWAMVIGGEMKDHAAAKNSRR
jgi:hypothetical protein